MVKLSKPKLDVSVPTENSEHYGSINLFGLLGSLFLFTREDVCSFRNSLIKGLIDSVCLQATQNHLRNLYLVLSLIVSKYSKHIDIWGNSFDSTFPITLHSKFDIEHIISSKQVGEYFNVLKDLKIIHYAEGRTGYRAGISSKQYTLLDNPLTFIPVTLNELSLPEFTDTRTNKLLLYFNDMKDFSAANSTEQFLWKNLFQISLDSGVFEYIDNHRELFPITKTKNKCKKCRYRPNKIKTRCPKCGSTDLLLTKNIDQAQVAINKLHRMNTGQFTFRPPSIKQNKGSDEFEPETIQCQRVFSSVTSLKREVRPFLRVNGNPLVEVDIHASQPLFATTLFRDDDEKKRWIDLYPTDGHGDFYENFADAAQAKLERETVKGHLVKECFNALDAYSKDGIRLKERFIDLFPHLNNQIDKMKFAEEYRKGLWPSHAVYNGMFGLLMQNLEAHIVITNICEEIRREHCIFVTPIHDALLVEPEYQQLVERLLKKHIQRQIGVTPKLSVKNHKQTERQTTMNKKRVSNYEKKS